MIISLIAAFLTLSLISGQIIKIPIGTHGGVTMLDITIIILCIFGLFKIKMHAKLPPGYISAAFVFILVTLLSLMVTPLHLTSLEYFTAVSYSVRFSLYILLGYLIYSKAFPGLNIPQVLIASGTGLAILGLAQFIFLPDLGFTVVNGWDPHYFRTVSTFLDPNFAGGFFVLTMVALLSFFKNKNLLKSKVFLIFFIILYFALLTTFSRSSYLMFLVSGLTISFLKKSKVFFFLTTILFLLLLVSFQIYIQLISQPRNIDRAQSASFRLNTWQQGLTLLQKSPVFGIGYNAYRYGLKEYQLGPEQFINSHGASSNDSSLLHVAATTGIVGLISFIIFLFTLFKIDNVILRGGLAGLLIHSVFANSLFYPPILLWIVLISASPRK